MKTLHPKVHGGIMYVRGNAEHEASVKEAGIKGIDLVVLDLGLRSHGREGLGLRDLRRERGHRRAVNAASSAKNHRYVTIATRRCNTPS